MTFVNVFIVLISLKLTCVIYYLIKMDVKLKQLDHTLKSIDRNFITVFSKND